MGVCVLRNNEARCGGGGSFRSPPEQRRQRMACARARGAQMATHFWLSFFFMSLVSTMSRLAMAIWRARGAAQVSARREKHEKLSRRFNETRAPQWHAP